jgi:hypothetical protein
MAPSYWVEKKTVMLPSIQQTRNRSNHHPTSYNSVMRCNPRGNIERTTHTNSYKRTTMRDNSIYCLRNPILRIIISSILSTEGYLPQMNSDQHDFYRNLTIQPSPSHFTKHSKPICLTTSRNLGTPQPSRTDTILGTEEKSNILSKMEFPKGLRVIWY